ncbi:MAG: DNA-binding protein [Acidobacteria bacterium]|nr:MAG: DNA-binding protein [Acidobacteriota bacterium]
MAGKADMVTRIHELTNITKTDVAMVYDEIFSQIGETLSGGDKVSIPNFGTFLVSERAARQGRNPATGATIQIAASKTARFKASKNLKEQL